MLKNEIEKYIPGQKYDGASPPYANILLVGQIASGKSSFVNSVDTAILGKISRRAKVTADGVSGTLKVINLLQGSFT